MCDSGKHTETGSSGGLVSTCPPVITQEVMEGKKESERKTRKMYEEGGGGSSGGMGGVNVGLKEESESFVVEKQK